MENFKNIFDLLHSISSKRFYWPVALWAIISVVYYCSISNDFIYQSEATELLSQIILLSPFIVRSGIGFIVILLSLMVFFCIIGKLFSILDGTKDYGSYLKYFWGTSFLYESLFVGALTFGFVFLSQNYQLLSPINFFIYIPTFFYLILIAKDHYISFEKDLDNYKF